MVSFPVADPQALRALKEGRREWEEYRQLASGRLIDLTFAYLEDAQLVHRVFERCNLGGAIMTRANLDYSEFTDCNLSGVDLTSASLVGVEILRCSAPHVVLENAVIRNAKIAELAISTPDVSGCRLESSDVEGMSLEGASGSRVLLSDVRMTACSLRSVAISVIAANISGSDLVAENVSLLAGSRIEGVELTACRIRQGSISASEVSGVALPNSRLVAPVIEDCSVSRLDLTDSVVVEAQAVSLGLQTATLFGASFVGCSWPDQAGRVSLLGKYMPSPSLMMQPVQDVRGVPALFRRETADAQFLGQLTGNSRGKTRRLALRLWGVSSGFGQSALRLACTTLGLILLHSVWRLQLLGELVGTSPNFGAAMSAFFETVAIFFGFTLEFDVSTSNLRIYQLSSRFFGFMLLGVWITVAARKITRLAND